MPPRVYKSHHPDIDLKVESVFSFLFTPDGQGNIGGHPGSKPAIIDADTGTTISRSVLRSLSLSLAYGLTGKRSSSSPPLVPLKKGDTITIFSPNSIAWPVVLFGSVAAGLRCTFANSAHTAGELHHQWSDSRASLVFAHPSGVPTVLTMFATHLGWTAAEARARIVVMGIEWLTGSADEGAEGAAGFTQLPALLNHGTLPSEVKFEGKATDETVFMCYSSGTTGLPKGVETTHANVASIMQMAVPVFPPTHKDDVTLGMLPFYSIGIVNIIPFSFHNGVPVVIMPRFNIEKFFAHVARYRITNAFIVPPMLAIAQHPAVSQHNLTSLRMLFSTAAPLGRTLVEATCARLRSVGAEVAITQAYGLTETSPTVHVLHPADSLRKVGSVGVLVPNLEARLVDDDERDVNEGQSGELWLRGPSVMKCYLGNEQATKQSITVDGWFKTGDIMTRDDEGFWTIVDRKKELIKYKSFQVPPAELEALLLAHPDVADVAVIGVGSRSEETELPRAYVVPTTVCPLSPQDHAAFGTVIQEWIKSRVAPHKQLRGGVRIVEVISKSAAGKILRRELREMAKRELADAARAKL
ncbi:acetyl-CoA synthetase-like protein [Athelia psychrophila]|uniref:Acetyl-CoA synthetase-like protein n=1 Tax=Athelia psychrophila TaxID=1759441 RepID=A0A165XJ54_9AGAM|nr:acetyl-CoA synthetase-like protein [Fibularhizoctonia sp. CBS 109695]